MVFGMFLKHLDTMSQFFEVIVFAFETHAPEPQEGNISAEHANTEKKNTHLYEIYDNVSYNASWALC